LNAEHQLSIFHNSPLLHFRDVTVRKNDDLPSHRQKLARIVLDEMYPFVGLLDANGNSLEINRAELDGAEIQLRPVLSVTTIGPIAAHSVLKLYA
jgi:hypothetical protein